MPKNQLWLVRPVGVGSDLRRAYGKPFRWRTCTAESPERAALCVAKHRKERQLEPRQTYEVVPLQLDQEGFMVELPGLIEGKPLIKNVSSFHALWDWNKRVEVRL